MRRQASMGRRRGPRTWALVAAAASLSVVAAASTPSWVSAEREVQLLMSMDHHLLQADLVVHVRALLPDADLSDEATPARVEVLDVWFSRWETQPDDVLSLAGVHVDPQEEYVFLISGGPFARSPLTHREHSFFHVRDGMVECGQGTTLFAVSSSGFLCSIQDLVAGAPIDVEAMRAQFERARGRAEERHPDLVGRLAADRRTLELAPDVRRAVAAEAFR